MKRNYITTLVVATLVVLFVIVLHQWQWFVATFVSGCVAIEYAIQFIKQDLGSSVYMEQLSRNHPQYEHECSIIAPINPVGIKTCLDVFDAFIQEDGLLDHVTFARLKTGFVDQVSCDWCSICNGILHSIYINSKTRSTLSHKQRLALLQMNDFIISAINTRPDVKYIQLNLQDLDRLSRIDVVKVIKHNLDHIELVYCPFKAFEEYYRNADPRYVPINQESIYKAGKVLHYQGRDGIECHECVALINREMSESYNTTNRPSPLNPLLKILKNRYESPT